MADVSFEVPFTSPTIMQTKVHSNILPDIDMQDLNMERVCLHEFF